VELKDLEAEILNTQSKPLQQLDGSKEAQLVTRYEQTLTKLNDFYVQRAKKNWAKDGDRNIAFFNRAVANRRRQNSIMSIQDLNNITRFMPDRIAHTFVTYFRSIFASSRTNANLNFTQTTFPQ
jgi:hypothetical protein